MNLHNYNKNLRNFIGNHPLTKSQKLLSFFVIILLVLDILAGIILLANKNKSSVKLLCGDKTSLFALDSAASKGIINNSYANFKFSEAQKDFFVKTYNENGTVSLTVCLQLMPTKKQKELLSNSSEIETVFRYGFLDSEDFTDKGKFIKKKLNRI